MSESRKIADLASSLNRGEAEQAAAAASCRLSLEGCSAMTPAKKKLMESNWPEQQQLLQFSETSAENIRLKERAPLSKAACHEGFIDKGWGPKPSPPGMEEFIKGVGFIDRGWGPKPSPPGVDEIMNGVGFIDKGFGPKQGPCP